MKLPFELRQKDVALPPAMAEDVRERADRLEHHFDRIMRCRVTIEGSGRHHRQGRYGVTVDITVPGSKLVVRKQEARNLDLALKEAFDAAERRLQDHSQKLRR